jgi:hypothetical protein
MPTGCVWALVRMGGAAAAAIDTRRQAAGRQV